MIEKYPLKIDILPVQEQINSFGGLEKRLVLNSPTGDFFNDPWITKPEFKNTPLGVVLDKLGNIGQARLLTLDSAESYTAHCDPDDRIHLSIITNEYSFLVDITENKMFHLPADGQLWKMNTGKIHVAANWGPRSRIHLNVRVLLPKYNSTESGLNIKMIEGDYDWKQLVYTPIMRVINRGIKEGYITGFKGINEKEILVNTTYPHIFNDAFEQIAKENITLEIINV